MFRRISWFIRVEKNDNGGFTYDPSIMRNMICYYQPNSMMHNPAWETNKFSASQENPPHLWNQRFIIAYKRASHLSLSWARSIQSMSHTTYWRSILKLSHLRLGRPNGLFLSGFPTKTLKEHFIQHVLHAPPIPLFFIWSPEYYLVRVQIRIYKKEAAITSNTVQQV